jgi:hypothetical protein
LKDNLLTRKEASLLCHEIAYVIALFKKRDKSLPSNYRPVSLLSCVSKILEKIVYKQIYNDNLLTRKEASLLCHNSRVLICKRFNPNCIKGFTNISKGCTSYLLFI